MNSQNSNTLNSNSFMHFSERVYGNPNDWLSKKDNNIYSKSFILLSPLFATVLILVIFFFLPFDIFVFV